MGEGLSCHLPASEVVHEKGKTSDLPSATTEISSTIATGSHDHSAEHRERTRVQQLKCHEPESDNSFQIQCGQADKMTGELASHELCHRTRHTELGVNHSTGALKVSSKEEPDLMVPDSYAAPGEHSSKSHELDPSAGARRMKRSATPYPKGKHPSSYYSVDADDDTENFIAATPCGARVHSHGSDNPASEKSVQIVDEKARVEGSGPGFEDWWNSNPEGDSESTKPPKALVLDRCRPCHLSGAKCDNKWPLCTPCREQGVECRALRHNDIDWDALFRDLLTVPKTWGTQRKDH